LADIASNIQLSPVKVKLGLCQWIMLLLLLMKMLVSLLFRILGRTVCFNP